MCGPPLERGSEGDDGQTVSIGDAAAERPGRRRSWKGMAHQGGVDVAEGAGVDELDLAAATLLCRRAQETHTPGPAGLLEGTDGAEERCDRGCGDQVVAAPVTDLGERIVLAAEGDDAAAGSVLGGEGGLEAVRMGGDGDPERAEQGDDVVVGLVLGETELRVVVDLRSSYQ